MPGFDFNQTYIEHGYVELCIPPSDGEVSQSLLSCCVANAHDFPFSVSHAEKLFAHMATWWTHDDCFAKPR